ncbi:hypothetical protein [Pseudogemmobacter sp. W21_MBD1_M6]|uniref:hypothetical protein n=1 Tax=Pseudogemmobacter sp. W21_MBD1_M6 TaxID=3240271 RepID=UPI003F9B4560
MAHAYDGHNAQLDKLLEEDKVGLRQHLSEEQLGLLDRISEWRAGNAELSKGRYPYENPDRKANDGETCFPVGDAGRGFAENWLSLARSLSEFRQPTKNGKAAD